NHVPENGLDGQRGNAMPFIKAPEGDQQSQLDAYSARITDLNQKLKSRAGEVVQAQAEWEKSALASLERAPALTTGLAAHYGLDETSGNVIHDAVGKQPDGRARGRYVTWAPGKYGNALSFDGNLYCEFGKGLA